MKNKHEQDKHVAFGQKYFLNTSLQPIIVFYIIQVFVKKETKKKKSFFLIFHTIHNNTNNNGKVIFLKGDKTQKKDKVHGPCTNPYLMCMTLSHIKISKSSAVITSVNTGKQDNFSRFTFLTFIGCCARLLECFGWFGTPGWDGTQSAICDISNCV